jgi:hypothetical protein
MISTDLNEIIKKEIESTIDWNVEKWAKYYFEKELLPHLKSQLKERVIFNILQSAEGMITFDVYFKPAVNK